MNPQPYPGPPLGGEPTAPPQRVVDHFVPYATYVLIAANLLVFAISGSRGGFGDTDFDVLRQLGMLFSPDVWDGQIWRLVSAQFLHGGLMHIGFNMYVLYSIGPELERIYRAPRFLLVYLGAGWMGSLSSLIWSGASVGASGAIFGLAGAFLAISLRKRSYFDAFGSQMLFFIGINLAIGFAGFFNIDNFGHMGGLVGGFILGNIVPNRLPEFKATPARWIATGVAVVAFAALTPFAVQLSQQVALSRAASQTP